MPLRKETTVHHQRDLKLKERVKKAKEHRKQRKLRKESGAPVGIPQTLETLRTYDETTIVETDPDLIAEEQAVSFNCANFPYHFLQDEVADIFRNERTPKLLLTFSDRVCPRTIGFCKELTKIIPNMRIAPRWHLPLKKIIPKAIEHGFTALLVVNEDQKKVNTLVVSHLPEGPTVTFRLSNVRLRREMRGRRRPKDIEPDVVPHLITSRFTTRLGRRTERLITSLFPDRSRSTPEGHSRTVVFHNQRDFIFFRHFRYQQRTAHANEKNKEPGKSYVAMNEVGPRFTLKLRSIQQGTFDTQFGDYEWVRKRSEVGRNRRTFVM
ncbi:ribosome production factor 1 [Clonorchis sinensis]|uniref:Ribosome production factor 1 n=1 Tax=Clonorchis sinensis TaxID=79923 RepID=H2KS94_CLOSI|nr:ribosome production factor 1 [Clonorchis sinensis]